MQAAFHWNVLAADVANQINNELIISDFIDTPIFIKATCGDENSPCGPQETSTFNEAFRDLLITELVGFGVPVQQQHDADAITVHYKVQLVYHRTNRLRTVRPGMLTSLATGITVFRNAPHEWATIATAATLDFLNQTATRSSHHEIIITTSMLAADSYLFRTSDIYYINDNDFFQYQQTAPTAAQIPVTSPAASTPLPGMNSDQLSFPPAATSGSRPKNNI